MSITPAVNAKEIFIERRLFGLLMMLSLIGAFTVAQAQPAKSVYTSVATRNCREIKSRPDVEGDYVGRCAGVGGYTLVLAEGDLRQNLTVVTPEKKAHSLDLWTAVSSQFSHIGNTVEWRVVERKPVALILRYNVNQDPEKPEKQTSYLVVAKITADEICVTDKVSPGTKANEEARRLAEQAGTKPCLKVQE
jgi:hypothetical protein